MGARRELRTSGRPRARAAVCLLALATSGCSVAFSEGPPAKHREMPYFDCSRRYAPPVVDDVIAAGGIGWLTYWALATPPTHPAPLRPAPMPGEPPPPTTVQEPRPPLSALLLLSIPLVAAPIASSIYGYKTTQRCRDAKAELMVRLTAATPAPPPEPPVTPPEPAATPPAPPVEPR